MYLNNLSVRFRMLFLPRRVHHNNIYIRHMISRHYCQNINKMSKIRNIGILAHIDAGTYLYEIYPIDCMFGPWTFHVSKHLLHILIQYIFTKHF